MVTNQENIKILLFFFLPLEPPEMHSTEFVPPKHTNANVHGSLGQRGKKKKNIKNQKTKRP